MKDTDLDDRMLAVLRQSNQKAYHALRLFCIALLVRRLVRDRELDRGILGVLLAATAVDAAFQLYYQLGALDNDTYVWEREAVEVEVE
ncbi:hypothetical protein [Haloarchaeobius sp. DFWS5]|uniref:hypothetical protein n=1 Tax=Haloarchaeobius sp. DFWS5 TaxID=3446114 RepID=UPI003EBFFFAF